MALTEGQVERVGTGPSWARRRWARALRCAWVLACCAAESGSAEAPEADGLVAALGTAAAEAPAGAESARVALCTWSMRARAAARAPWVRGRRRARRARVRLRRCP